MDGWIDGYECIYFISLHCIAWANEKSRKRIFGYALTSQARILCGLVNEGRFPQKIESLVMKYESVQLRRINPPSTRKTSRTEKARALNGSSEGGSVDSHEFEAGSTTVMGSTSFASGASWGSFSGFLDFFFLDRRFLEGVDIVQ